MKDIFLTSGDLRFRVKLSSEKFFSKNTIVLLHGFTGSAEDFSFMEGKIGDLNIVCPDLAGHGKTSCPDDIKHYTADAMVTCLHSLFNSLGLRNFFLLGYSMGGRLALSFSLKYKHMIKGLILESSTPGITDELLKTERAKSDKELAAYIKENSIVSFVNFWMHLPLFESQRKMDTVILDRIRKRKLKNSRTGLSNSLLGFSTGVMPSLWDRLGEIDFPMLLITGSDDAKYTVINAGILDALHSATICEHVIFSGCGHNIHLENPAGYIDAVNKFICQHS